MAYRSDSAVPVVRLRVRRGRTLEVVVLHQAGHVLMLFVRHVGYRGVKLGERRHHAVTEPD